MKEGLSPRERIKKKKDFLILYRKGNRYKSKYFNLICLSSELPYSRVGVVASRKVGGAVTRNRVKRWMRELFRRNKDLLGHPVDLIIVATPEMRNATWAELREQYSRALGRMFEERRSR